MNVARIASNPLFALNMLGRAGASAASAFLPVQIDAAKSAASAPTLLPSTSAVQLTPEALIALQGTQQESQSQTVEIKPPSIEDQFLAEARKSPMQRMREQIMKELGITEEQLNAMPPEEKQAMEDRIRQLIEEKIREAHNAGDGPPQSNGEMLQSLL
jgi:hypothetical protein